jgi:carboxypeptidase Q
MTRPHSSSRTIAAKVCFIIGFGTFWQTAARAQNQQPKPAPLPFANEPQSAAQLENFPAHLLADLSSIKAAALSDDYAYRQVAHLTENIGPRASGSPQAKAAVDYVAAELRQLGLDVQLEEVKVPHWVRGAETAELTEYAGQAAGSAQKIVLAALGGSTSTPAEGTTADLVVVNNFGELKSLGREKITGKIVLFNEIFDKQKAAGGMAFIAYGEAVRYRGAGPKAAADLGAVAALAVLTSVFRIPASAPRQEFPPERSRPKMPT